MLNVNVQVGYRAIPGSYAVGDSETGHTSRYRFNINEILKWGWWLNAIYF